MAIYRLIYYSENHIDYRTPEARETITNILTVSRRNNENRQISGALILDDLWFIQSLEGNREQVWETYKKITNDERHHNIVICQANDYCDRVFGNWTMAFAVRNAETAKAFDLYAAPKGLNPPAMSAQDMVDLLRQSVTASISPLLSTV
jgi:hypothetical protein